MTESTPTTPPEANDADTVSAGTDETADVPVDNEGPVAYSSETTPSSSAAASTGRSAVIAPASGTGRRKQAVARVRLIPGTGQWKVNGRDLDAYFPNKVHQQHVKEPLATLGVDEQYDVIANLDGGGSSGQAGALRLGVARALNEVDSEVNRPSLKRSGMLTRDARVKERRKAGLKKARKAPQYSKR